jgi:hypothetical protein
LSRWIAPPIYPLALRDAGSEVRVLWMGLTGEVMHPIARARCHDIAFILRLGQNNRNNRDHAEQAAARLQAAPPVEWKTFTSPDIKLPEFYVHTFLHPFRHASTWREALGAGSDCGVARYS